MLDTTNLISRIGKPHLAIIASNERIQRSVCLSACLSVDPPNWLLECDVIPPVSMLKPWLSNATTMH